MVLAGEEAVSSHRGVSSSVELLRQRSDHLSHR
jgi:hypothetical protein